MRTIIQVMMLLNLVLWVLSSGLSTLWCSFGQGNYDLNVLTVFKTLVLIFFWKGNIGVDLMPTVYSITILSSFADLTENASVVGSFVATEKTVASSFAAAPSVVPCISTIIRWGSCEPLSCKAECKIFSGREDGYCALLGCSCKKCGQALGQVINKAT